MVKSSEDIPPLNLELSCRTVEIAYLGYEGNGVFIGVREATVFLPFYHNSEGIIVFYWV